MDLLTVTMKSTKMEKKREKRDRLWSSTERKRETTVTVKLRVQFVIEKTRSLYSV